MNIPPGKKVVCITGTVWTGDAHAPRHLLVKDGFVRPTWFTTRIGLNDGDFRIIQDSEFRLARANDRILVNIKYANDAIGIMKECLLDAINQSSLGALVVGPQDIAAQLAEKIPQTVIFALKNQQMPLSHHLEKAKAKGHVHRIDLEGQDSEHWTQAHRTMRDILNIANDES